MYTGELVIGGIGIITTAASAWVSHFFTRKKYHTEVDYGVIENLEKSLKFYEELSAHNQDMLKELTEENKDLRREVAELRKQLQELTTNLYLDEAYKNRVKTREMQLKNQNKNAKGNSRFDETKETDRG